jgi:hypothetical protein
MNLKALEIIDRIIECIHELSNALVGDGATQADLMGPGIRQAISDQGKCGQCGGKPVVTVMDNPLTHSTVVTVTCHDESDTGAVPYIWFEDDQYRRILNCVRGLLPTRLVKVE